MKDLIVVYRFCNKKPTSIEIANLRKFAPETKYEDVGNNNFAITLGHFYTQAEANKVIHNAVANGYWGGVLSE